MRSAGLIGLLLFTGCVTTPRPKPPPPALTLKLSPASLGRELALSQRITVVREGERRSFDAQLEVDASAVRIAAVAMGQTFASLTWDGRQLEQRVSERVPEVVTAERILSDVQLAWWPGDAVRAALPAGYRLEEQGTQRTLFEGEAKVATITYEGTGPAWPRVKLTQHLHGYALEIESVEAGP